MATEEELLSEWYEALSKEDSLRVQALLADHPSLLKVGWGDDALQFHGNEEPWKHRTALHVGVKRGNAELVQQVLILCKVDIPKKSTTKEPDKGNLPSTSSESQTDVGEIEETPKNANNVSGSSQDDSQGIGGRQLARWTVDGKLAEKTGIQTALSIISGSKRKRSHKRRDMARLTVAKWKRQVSDTRFVDDLYNNQDSTFLRRLLLAKHGEYNLDAIAIAVLHGNRKIFLLILYAMGKSKLYGVTTDSLPDLDVTEESEDDRDHRAKLREATEEVVWKFSREEPTSYGRSCLEKYKEHLDFNFLPWQEYLFHFLLASDFPAGDSKEEFTREVAIATDAEEFARALWTAIRSCPGSTWRFLLKLQDGQGRTPINVAFRKSSFFEAVVANDKGEMEDEVVDCIMATPDGAGRTALHRALATGDPSLVSRILIWSQFPFVEATNTKVREKWEHAIPSVVHDWTSKRVPQDACAKCVNIVSSTNGFNAWGRKIRDTPFAPADQRKFPIPSVESTPPYTAILHNHTSSLWTVKNEIRTVKKAESKMREFFPAFSQAVQSLQDRKHGEAEDVEETKAWHYWGLDESLFSWVHEVDGRAKWVELDAVELAVLMKDARATNHFPLGAYNFNCKYKISRTLQKQPWAALHIAANAGNYEMVKILLDHPLSDPYIKDCNGNTALHHALNVVTIGKFQPHLLDYVNCEHLQANDPRNESQEVANDDPLFDRQECIDLLLDAGLNILETNQQGERPYPQGKLTKNFKFVAWWRERKAKDIEAVQTTLSFAINLISVTATLIASASYVGPLQPPMGYAGDPAQIQDANHWVKIFMFCDTLSFYFAIFTIILSFVPSVRLRGYNWANDKEKARQFVALLFATLCTSVLFILLAFISSCVAVVSDKETTSSEGRWLVIATACFGGLLCLFSLGVFFDKAVGSFSL